jgi:hypothetical protein
MDPVRPATVLVEQRMEWPELSGWRARDHGDTQKACGSLLVFFNFCEAA